MRDEDAADRRRQHGACAHRAERLGERGAERFRGFRVLEHQRGLEIHVGVKARGEPEVAA